MYTQSTVYYSYERYSQLRRYFVLPGGGELVALGVGSISPPPALRHLRVATCARDARGEHVSSRADVI